MLNECRRFLISPEVPVTQILRNNMTAAEEHVDPGGLVVRGFWLGLGCGPLSAKVERSGGRQECVTSLLSQGILKEEMIRMLIDGAVVH